MKNTGILIVSSWILYMLLYEGDMGYWAILLLLGGSLWTVHRAGYAYHIDKENLPWVNMLFFFNCVSLCSFFLFWILQYFMFNTSSISYHTIQLRMIWGIIAILILNLSIMQGYGQEEPQLKKQTVYKREDVFITRASTVVRRKMWINKYNKKYDLWTNFTFLCASICLLTRRYIWTVIILVVALNGIIWLIFFVTTYVWRICMAVYIGKRSYKNKQNKNAKICQGESEKR